MGRFRPRVSKASCALAQVWNTGILRKNKLNANIFLCNSYLEAQTAVGWCKTEHGTESQWKDERWHIRDSLSCFNPSASWFLWMQPFNFSTTNCFTGYHKHLRNIFFSQLCIWAKASEVKGTPTNCSAVWHFISICPRYRGLEKKHFNVNLESTLLLLHEVPRELLVQGLSLHQHTLIINCSLVLVLAGRVDFLHSSWFGAVFWICAENTIDNRNIFSLL